MPDQKKRDFFPKKEVVRQLDDLLERGQPLHYEQDIPLTPQDVTLIKRLFFKIALFCFIFSVPFALALYFFKHEQMVWLICGAVLLCFGFIVVKAAYQLGSNLRAGKKTIVRGVITDRFKKKHYGAVDEDGKRSEKMLSYLKIGTREFQVETVIYEKHKTGEAVELEYIVSLKGKPFILHNRKLKGAGISSGSLSS